MADLKIINKFPDDLHLVLQLQVIKLKEIVLENQAKSLG